MAERNSNGRWAPGVSGNPGGRPAEVAEIRELARQHTEAALTRLAAIVESDKSSDAAAVSAAREILDRGYGRAPQYIDQTLRDQRESPEEYMPDLDEMRRIMRGQRAKASPAGEDGKGKEVAMQKPDEVGHSLACAAVGETADNGKDKKNA